MSLTPWDLSGLGLSFGFYRPRRPSYTLATQYYRQRSESYRHATRRENSDLGSNRESEAAEDFIEDVLQKRRKESYVRATRQLESFELNTYSRYTGAVSGQGQPETLHLQQTDLGPDADNFTPIPREFYDNHIPTQMSAPNMPNKQIMANSHSSVFHEQPPVSSSPATMTGDQHPHVHFPQIKPWKYRKNLIFLCVSFIFTFSAFRAIQNLQTSLNANDNLGLLSVSCIHGTMVLTGVFVPIVINRLHAKFSLALGMFCYLLWIAANFYPRFYTMLPAAVLAGFGQGILWTGEISYIIKLAFDASKIATRLDHEHEVFRFHGIFVACFQTTHMWGNLISSLMLKYPSSSEILDGNGTLISMDIPIMAQQCGVLHPCDHDSTSTFMYEFDIAEDGGGLPVLPTPPPTEQVYPELWQLMCAYLVLGVVGFLLILFCLDRIGAQVDPAKTNSQLIFQHVTFMCTHKTFRLLIPMLVFSGLQQGFIFSDFNKAYVTCSLGIQYVGYCMITLGVFNILSAVLIAVCARIIPREVVLGFGSITHIGLMIGFLVWIPDNSLVMFLVLAAAWGVCDAVWLTQCNSLICITCPDNTDLAFAGCRLLQSFGLFLAFVSGTFMCVAGKLYMLIAMLVLAILCYVMAEYRMRHIDNDDVFVEEDVASHGAPS